MTDAKNALAELAKSMKRKVGDFLADDAFKDVMDNAKSQEEQKAAAFFREYALASRIVAELAKHNINLIPQECYGCGVLKTLAKCREIAEERN